MRAAGAGPERLRRLVAAVGGVTSAAAGTAALAGWFLGLPALARLLPGYLPMAPSSALLLLLYGACVILLARGRQRATRLPRTAGAAGALVALALLALSALRIRLDAEHLWLSLPVTAGEHPVGHISPLTALCLLLAGLALFALPEDSRRQPVAARWSLGSSGLLAAAGSLMLLAYLFGAPVLYTSAFIPPAATTVGALLALGIALAALAWPGAAGDATEDRGVARAARPVLLGFLLLSAGIVLAGLFSYQHYERRYRAEVERRLAAIAELKTGGLVQWRQERLGDALLLSGNSTFTALAGRLFAAPGDADARLRLTAWLDGFRAYGQYGRVSLLDAAGVERLATLDASGPPDPYHAEAARAALAAGEVAFLDFHHHRTGAEIRLGVVAPLFEEGDPGRPLGAVALEIDPAVYLYPFLARWPAESRSAETLIVRRDGNTVTFLNNVRFRPGSALSLRLPAQRTEVPAVAAVGGRTGIVEGPDYRGVPVIADVRAVPGSPWFLVSRMDAAEVYAPLRERLWLTVALIAALLFGAGGTSGLLWRQRMLGLYRDRLAAERERGWLRTVIARSLNEIFVFDAETLRFSFVNDGACANLGYALPELLRLTPLDLKPRFDAASFAELVRPLREGRIAVLAFETAHRRKDGSEYPVEVHLQLVEAAHGPVFLAVINDITERSRAEAQLRLNEARLESLLDISEHTGRSEQELLDFALHRALALTGSAVGYLYLYREETRQFTLNSWSREVMEACTVVEPQTVHDLEKTGVWGEAVRQRRPILINDFAAAQPLQRGYPPGHVPLANFLTVPVFSGLEIVAVVGVANKAGGYDESDILQLTLLMASVWRVLERKRAESELSERNTELERFIYTVSHDLKSPLVTIRAFLAYLEADLDRDDRARVASDLQYLRTAAAKMSGLLDDVLEMSRVGRVVAEPTTAGFAELAAEAVSLVAGAVTARGVEVRIEPAAVTLRGDRNRLVEIWQNLVENAVKFMGAQPAPLVEIGVEQREGEVVFFVRDNGIGIDPRYQERIFGLFDRLDPAVEGTGLGLALVRRIVELHGGTIRVASAGPGCGSTFLFTLPAALAAGAKARGAP